MLRECLSQAALYEGLAEEASELAQAALKAARILRDENPTPIHLDEAEKNIKEEFSDVCLMARESLIYADVSIMNHKEARAIERISQARKENVGGTDE